MDAIGAPSVFPRRVTALCGIANARKYLKPLLESRGDGEAF